MTVDCFLRRAAVVTLVGLLALSPLRTVTAQTVAAAPPDKAAAEQKGASRDSLSTELPSKAARTRFLIGLARASDFQVFSLAEPNRVIVDVAQDRLELPPEPKGGPAGVVKSFRGGLSAPGQSRVVIDVTVPVVVESATIESGADGKTHRLALDIVPVEPAAARKRTPLDQIPFGLGAAGVQPPMPRLAIRPKERAARARKWIIVIDPGHGGDDTGAQKNGAVEKEVVLAFGKVLRDKLEAAGGYKVLMTRDTDVFVPLDKRTKFAEQNKADLFIAVHADYAKSDARGATIYSLRDGVAAQLKRSAKNDADEVVLSDPEASTIKKASADMDAVNTVRSFLADLLGREVEETHERTGVFQQTVIETMGTSTEMRDHPDKQASFRVLKTAQVPSVLIELAYVTNKEDAELLKSDEWRNKVADSIMTAVGNYFSHEIARPPGTTPEVTAAGNGVATPAH